MAETEHITVHREAVDALRQAVVDHYGKLRGNLMREASAALEDRARRLREGGVR